MSIQRLYIPAIIIISTIIFGNLLSGCTPSQSATAHETKRAVYDTTSTIHAIRGLANSLN